MHMHNFHSDLLESSGQALLKNSTILQAEGADAATFLQGQFSQNIINLADKSACFAGLSNPKGRLIVSAYIYKKSKDLFWLVIPSSMLDESLKHLSKYVMRSKVKFSHAQEIYLYGLWNSTTENQSVFEDQFNLAKHANLSIGFSDKTLNIDLDDEAHWTLLKILNVIPEVNPQTQEHFVAQMLNMDVLEGISFNKGCYTGQEIIARMQHLGRIKRRTLLIKSQTELSPGEKISLKETSLGEVINYIKFQENFFCLAVIQLDKLKKIVLAKEFEDTGLTIYNPPYALEQKT